MRDKTSREFPTGITPSLFVNLRQLGPHEGSDPIRGQNQSSCRKRDSLLLTNSTSQEDNADPMCPVFHCAVQPGNPTLVGETLKLRKYSQGSIPLCYADGTYGTLVHWPGEVNRMTPVSIVSCAQCPLEFINISKRGPWQGFSPAA